MTAKQRPDIPVLYEDNHLLVVCKPVNVPSQEDISGDPDLLTLLKADLKQRHRKPGNVFLSLVHRLDRPVGGVMVLAKTSKAASRLSARIREGGFGKRYLCVVHGSPSHDQAVLEHHLRKDRARNIVTVVNDSSPVSKKAVLEYVVLGSSGGLSLIEVTLHTGRSHQIRVQLSTIGCPLYGDQKYGAELTRLGQQLALWSSVIEFPHPTQEKRMRFTSRPPDVSPWNVFSMEAADL